MRRGACLVGVVGIAVALSGCAAAAPLATSVASPAGNRGYALSSHELVVGVVSTPDTDLKPLLDYLAHVSHRKVEVVETRGDDSLVQAARGGQLDLALLSPAAYLRAVGAGARLGAVAAMVPPGATSPADVSLGIAPAGSPIHTLAALGGKRVCFPDTESTAGYLYPATALTHAGIDPVHGIVPVLSGGDAETAQLISSGGCDAGFVTMSSAIAAGTIFSRIPVPTTVLAVSTTLPAALRTSLGSATDDLTVATMAKGGVAVTADFRRSFAGLRAIPANYFDGLRAACAGSTLQTCAGFAAQ